MGEHLAAQRTGEDEIVLAREAGAPKVGPQLLFHPVRKRHRAFTAARLWRRPMTARVVAAYPDPLRFPINVAPAQREQLPLAHAGHGRSQEDRSVGGPEGLLGDVDGGDHRIELYLVENPDLRALSYLRAAHGAAWVLLAPAVAHGEVEDLREELEDARARARRQSGLCQSGHELLDIPFPHPVDGELAESR